MLKATNMATVRNVEVISENFNVKFGMITNLRVKHDVYCNF